MAALADDPASVEHDNRVGGQDRTETVRDYEGRRASRFAGCVLHQPVDRLLDEVLALGVDLAGRLVKYQDRRLAQDSPRDADSLLLSARKLASKARELSHNPAAFP